MKAVEVTPEELNEIRFLHNNVLVKLPYTVDDVYSGDIEIHSNYDWERLLPKRGIVMSVPEAVDTEGFEWQPHIEIEKGDEVWFQGDPSAISSGRMEYKGDGKNFICEGAFYLSVQYHYILLAKRGENFIPCNGYIICKDHIPQSSVYIAMDEKKVPKEVVYVGKDNKRYTRDFMQTANEPKVGDVLITEDVQMLRLENPTVAIMEPLFACHRHFILGYE
jgi:hypothetical protein